VGRNADERASATVAFFRDVLVLGEQVREPDFAVLDCALEVAKITPCGRRRAMLVEPGSGQPCHDPGGA
jgi:hypothetical protein